MHDCHNDLNLKLHEHFSHSTKGNSSTINQNAMKDNNVAINWCDCNCCIVIILQNIPKIVKSTDVQLDWPLLNIIFALRPVVSYCALFDYCPPILAESTRLIECDYLGHKGTCSSQTSIEILSFYTLLDLIVCFASAFNKQSLVISFLNDIEWSIHQCLLSYLSIIIFRFKYMYNENFEKWYNSALQTCPFYGFTQGHLSNKTTTNNMTVMLLNVILIRDNSSPPSCFKYVRLTNTMSIVLLASRYMRLY